MAGPEAYRDGQAGEGLGECRKERRRDADRMDDFAGRRVHLVRRGR